MAVPQGYQYQQVQQQRPSCWDKLKMGFIMGCMIGGSTGLIIGSFTTFRFTFLYYIYKITLLHFAFQIRIAWTRSIPANWQSCGTNGRFFWRFHDSCPRIALLIGPKKGANQDEIITDDENLFIYQ